MHTGEWEGAILRNSRVSCNVILPLLSSQSISEVPLLAVDSALSDYATAISNVLGSRPKCMLWTTLFDIRWLLLRIAHGEPLNADCGGGSLSSNSLLVFYLMHLASMFGKTAMHESPSTAQHFEALHLGYIAAWEIMQAKDYDGSNERKLQKGVTDASPMAALCCILHDGIGCEMDAEGEKTPRKEKRLALRHWGTYRLYFLKGLLRCAGWRHKMKVEESGCMSGRRGGVASSGTSGPNDPVALRRRINSFADWDVIDASEGDDEDGSITEPSRTKGVKGSESSSFNFSVFGRRRSLGMEECAATLRPMCVLFAILDSLSQSYTGNMSGEEVSLAAEELVSVAEKCQKAASILELLVVSKVSDLLGQEETLAEVEKGSATVA